MMIIPGLRDIGFEDGFSSFTHPIMEIKDVEDITTRNARHLAWIGRCADERKKGVEPVAAQPKEKSIERSCDPNA